MRHSRSAARVTIEHVRALCGGSQGRTAGVFADNACAARLRELFTVNSGLRAVTPDQAFDWMFDCRCCRMLCSRGELLDDGQLVGPTVAVCTRVAAYLNTAIEEMA